MVPETLPELYLSPSVSPSPSPLYIISSLLPLPPAFLQMPNYLFLFAVRNTIMNDTMIFSQKLQGT
jgi:hypothetical protein